MNELGVEDDFALTVHEQSGTAVAWILLGIAMVPVLLPDALDLVLFRKAWPRTDAAANLVGIVEDGLERMAWSPGSIAEAVRERAA